MNKSLRGFIAALSLCATAATEQLKPPFTYQAQVVICVLRPGQPWQEVGRGTLKRGTAGNRTDYAFSADRASYSWWKRINPDGSATYFGGPSLADYLSPLIPQERERHVHTEDSVRTLGSGQPAPSCDYRSSVSDTGEIHDRCGPFEARTVVGPNCPMTSALGR